MNHFGDLSLLKRFGIVDLADCVTPGITLSAHTVGDDFASTCCAHGSTQKQAKVWRNTPSSPFWGFRYMLWRHKETTIVGTLHL